MILGLLACDGGVTQQQPLEPEEEHLFSFVVFADPHIVDEGEHLDRLDTAVDWVNAHADERGIELVVVVGDLGWSGGLELARAHLDGLEVPYLPVLGDNEVHFGDEQLFDEIFADVYADLGVQMAGWRRAESETWNPVYEKTSWFQNFSFNYRGLRLVGLDWISRDENNVLSEMAQIHDFEGGTLPWFAEELEGLTPAGEEDVLLFSHHAMHLSPGAFGLDDLAQVTDLTSGVADRVAAGWAGHYHLDFEETVAEGGYDVFVTDATWDDENTIRVVEVHQTGYAHTYDQELVVL